MNRAICMLGTVAALVAGVLFAPSAANALDIQCEPVPLSQPIYPNDTPPANLPTHAFWCVNNATGNGATVQNGSAMAGTIRDMNGVIGPGGDGYQKLKNSPLPGSSQSFSWPFPSVGKAFFIFFDAFDAEKFFQERGLPYSTIPNEAFGVTLKDQLPSPDAGETSYSAIFLKNKLGQFYSQVGIGLTLQWITAHEAGHTLNNAYLPLSQTLDPNARLFSESKMFYDIVSKDISNFNKPMYKPCSTNQGPGVFTARTSVITGAYICDGVNGTGPNLTAAFAGKKNYEILVAAFGTTMSQLEEFFPNSIAQALGNTTGSTPAMSSYFYYFPCTMTLVREMVNFGDLPFRSDMKAVKQPGTNTSAKCPVKKGGADPWKLPTEDGTDPQEEDE